MIDPIEHLTFHKGVHTYRITYRVSQVYQASDQLGCWAANEELNLSWKNSADISAMIERRAGMRELTHGGNQ